MVPVTWRRSSPIASWKKPRSATAFQSGSESAASGCATGIATPLGPDARVLDASVGIEAPRSIAIPPAVEAAAGAVGSGTSVLCSIVWVGPQAVRRIIERESARVKRSTTVGIAKRVP